jgi:hypothetical protein
MIVLIRSPLGATLTALTVLAVMLFVLSSLDRNAGRAADGDLKVQEIRASSAPLLAADLAGFAERRRREGHGGQGLVDAWLAQYRSTARQDMRSWLAYHDAHVSAGADGVRIETSSGPKTDGWFRIEVDRAETRIALTCGGSPAPGCVRGRWSLEPFGHSRAYLLGR